MNYKQNYSLEGDLSPRSLKSELAKPASADFLDSYAGRKAVASLLFTMYQSTLNARKHYYKRIGEFEDEKDDVKADYLRNLSAEHVAMSENLLNFVHDLLEMDYDAVPTVEDDKFIQFWEDTINGKQTPQEAVQRRKWFLQQPEEANSSFWDKLKSKFNNIVSSWRGYNDEELEYGKSDIAFRKLLAQDLKNNPYAYASAKAFSNNGVKNMKVKRPVRKTFSNAQACDMLAHKLTNDWFICEPECQPLISEQLKAAQVPVASFAPALKCNVFQYDGEAAVSKSELAALDKVQQFVQALKDEIACGNDCGGIKMVPEAKAFSLKRNLKKMVHNFAETGEIEMEEIATPNELIKAEEAGIDLDNPEMYEEVADKAEAGELPAELMAPMAPAVVAPTSIDEDSLGYAYNDLVDSTIADDEGITQEDMSGYDAAPGELSLSAAPVGNAMAEAQADAIVWEDEDAAPMKPVAAAPIMAPAAPQNFSRSVRRQQKAAAQKKNFSAKQPAKSATRTISVRGLHRLLGDNYIK